MPYYLDSSAAMKLVVREPHSTAMVRFATANEGNIRSSDLIRTELQRAVRRAAPHRLSQVHSVLRAVVIHTVATSTYERAGMLDSPLLRSLDALHLASALELGDALEGIVTYDDRLADAARAHGVAVVAPH